MVVVAHSQGTVVAADFFRFIHATGRNRPGVLPPIHMFSAGSPLRQLYALRFPVLYHWVRRPAPGSTGPVGPDEEECGFARWVNAYRSGDYVGRCLWASESDENRWTPSEMPERLANRTAEFCIGGAAHTHYFDEGNGRIGRSVDRLVWLDGPSPSPRGSTSRGLPRRST